VKFIGDEGEYYHHLDQLLAYQTKLGEETIPKADEAVLFSQAAELLELHGNILKELKSALKSYPEGGPGEVILAHLSDLKAYTGYTLNAAERNSCFERLMADNKAFSSFMKVFMLFLNISQTKCSPLTNFFFRTTRPWKKRSLFPSKLY
jgi:hypothetical protein